MKYADFENIMSAKRMGRYLTACGGDTRKAMTLYRYNLQLSQVMFTIVSCFEVVLRNSIDRKLTENLGNEWVRDSIMTGGVFSLPILRKTSDIIAFAYRKLQQSRSYSHTKLLAEMEFGIWKYMFSQSSIVLPDEICFPFFQTNHALRERNSIIRRLYSMNLTR